MWDSFVDAGAGALIGFVLAQLYNGAKELREWLERPKLVIETRHPNSVLETLERHTVYGFSLRNTGRTIATGVRVQLVEIVARHDEDRHYLLLNNAYDLSPYRLGKNEPPSIPLTLVPKTEIEIGLASRNDYDGSYMEDEVIYPSGIETPELFLELADGADEYRYKVVAFDDRGRFAEETLILR